MCLLKEALIVMLPERVTTDISLPLSSTENTVSDFQMLKTAVYCPKHDSLKAKQWMQWCI